MKQVRLRGTSVKFNTSLKEEVEKELKEFAKKENLYIKDIVELGIKLAIEKIKKEKEVNQ